MPADVQDMILDSLHRIEKTQDILARQIGDIKEDTGARLTRLEIRMDTQDKKCADHNKLLEDLEQLKDRGYGAGYAISAIATIVGFLVGFLFK